jgi:hypothetical protein
MGVDGAGSGRMMVLNIAGGWNRLRAVSSGGFWC